MELADLKTRIAASTSIVGFTGAGISTESGIPDYRGTGALLVIINVHIHERI